MSYNIEQQIKLILDVPTYYKKYIDRTVNLEETPKVCCPFHEEDTPSFSYNTMTGTWRCFGSCKFGGDVIAMHQRKHKMHSRREAMDSLAMLHNINTRNLDFTLYDDIKVDEREVKLASLLHKAESLCKGVNDWVALDYIMSFNKPKTELIEDLDEFILHRRVD